jgi:hypothetical protein
MSARLDLPAAPPPGDRNPWLGLASFTEGARASFFGREEETADLARRVQRRLVTVLFGKSGLGKTSLVSAGLVPRLRAQGYCPIPLRISYSRNAPASAQQIRQAILVSGGPGAAGFVAGAPDGASPWELLHRREQSLRDAGGASLTPLLIFDQFEEIFTLAQSDDAGRARAAAFVSDLADLVENRPPANLEVRLEQDDSLAEAFDFARSNYRVLIVLREDYLASLESLTRVMPSLAQNRLRLAPMTGTQALEAVLGPGKGLVTDEVAAAIVRFVAGGAELANAEVEPSLLSLFCRELNDARIAQGRNEISLDLLAGSHASILQQFYERALADQPPGVRSLVEDKLLTSSGYRESVAEEDLLAHLAAVGASPDTLTALVNRRLLRIEERLDARRVELTHDVLCPVVKESRDRRREREEHEATQRLLAQQREREAAARRALARARRVALACTVLALLALGAAVLAYISLERARHAEQEARQTRALADQARVQAERLLEYLSDDFARTLESEGRIDVVAELSKRQIDYFHGLPAALRGVDTRRNGALALVHHARAALTLGDPSAGEADAREASQLLEGLRSHGDASEATTIALARSYLAQAQILESRLDASSTSMLDRATGILRPLAEASGADAAVRAAYVEALILLGATELASHPERTVGTEQHAVELAAGLGARDLTDLDMAARSAVASSQVVDALIALGRDAEARKVGEEAIGLADGVIARRPGHRTALQAQRALAESLASLARNELNPQDAVRFSQRSEQVSATLMALDPSSVLTRSTLGAAEWNIGAGQWDAGELRKATESFRRSLEHREQSVPGGAVFLVDSVIARLELEFSLARIGEVAPAQALFVAGQPLRDRLRKSEGALGAVTTDCTDHLWGAEQALRSGDYGRARQLAQAARQALQSVSSQDKIVALTRAKCQAVAADIGASAEYELGDFAAAEEGWRVVLAGRQQWASASVVDRLDLADYTASLAMAVARQGRRSEAATLIAPVVQFLREQAPRNHGNCWVPLQLALALYAQALAEPSGRDARLREAAALVEGLAPQLRSLRDVRQWRERILEAQQNPGL